MMRSMYSAVTVKKPSNQNGRNRNNISTLIPGIKRAVCSKIRFTKLTEPQGN